MSKVNIVLFVFLPFPSFFLHFSTPSDINLNSPNKGVGVNCSDSLSDLPVEGAVGNSVHPPPPGLTEEEAEELRTELAKVGLLTCPCWAKEATLNPLSAQLVCFSSDQAEQENRYSDTEGKLVKEAEMSPGV